MSSPTGIPTHPSSTTSTATTSNNTIQQQSQNTTTSTATAPNAKISNEEFVADPLPFDYGEFAANDIGGRDIINMAHTVMGDENNRMIRRSLPEPKAIRDHYQSMQSNLPYALAQQHQSMNYQMHHQHPQQQHMMHSGHPMFYGAAPMHQMSSHPSFQSMMDHKKENHPSQNAQHEMQPHGIQHHYPSYPHPSPHFTMPYINTHSVSTPQQEVSIKLKTQLKTKYWRNGRRNLQCFPNCKIFGDYSYIKIDDLKQHDFMWGKCRGSLVTEVTLNGSCGFDDLIILGRIHSLENIPIPFEEAVIGECMIGRIVASDIMDIMKDQWITGERLPDFMQQSSRVACYEFKPKVWKYSEDMTHGKCKRRNVCYYCQFEAFATIYQGDVRSYMCVGSGMSSSFEVGSSRVLARQKRKAAGRLNEVTKKKKSPADEAIPELKNMPTMKEVLVHEEKDMLPKVEYSTKAEFPI